MKTTINAQSAQASSSVKSYDKAAVQPIKTIPVAEVEGLVNQFKGDLVKRFADYLQRRMPIDVLDPAKLTATNFVESLGKVKRQDVGADVQNKVNAIENYWAFIIEPLDKYYLAFQSLEECTIQEFETKIAALNDVRSNVEGVFTKIMVYRSLKLDFFNRINKESADIEEFNELAEEEIVLEKTKAAIDKLTDISELEKLITDIDAKVKKLAEEETALENAKAKIGELTNRMQELITFKNIFDKNELTKKIDELLTPSEFNNGLTDLIQVSNPAKAEKLVQQDLVDTKRWGAAYTDRYINFKNNFEQDITEALNIIDQRFSLLRDGITQQLNMAIDKAEKEIDDAGSFLMKNKYKIKTLSSAKASEVDKALLPNISSNNEVIYVATLEGSLEAQSVLNEVKSYLEEMSEELRLRLLDLRLLKLPEIEKKEVERFQAAKGNGFSQQVNKSLEQDSVDTEAEDGLDPTTKWLNKYLEQRKQSSTVVEPTQTKKDKNLIPVMIDSGDLPPLQAIASNIEPTIIVSNNNQGSYQLISNAIEQKSSTQPKKTDSVQSITNIAGEVDDVLKDLHELASEIVMPAAELPSAQAQPLVETDDAADEANEDDADEAMSSSYIEIKDELPPDQNPPPPAHKVATGAPGSEPPKADTTNIVKKPYDLIDLLAEQAKKFIQSRDSDAGFLTKVKNVARNTNLRKAKSALMKCFMYELVRCQSEKWDRKTFEERLEIYRIANYALEEMSVKDQNGLKIFAAYDNGEINKSNYQSFAKMIDPACEEVHKRIKSSSDPVIVGKPYLPGMGSGFDRTIVRCFELVDWYYDKLNKEETQGVRCTAYAMSRALI